MSVYGEDDWRGGDDDENCDGVDVNAMNDDESYGSSSIVGWRENEN